MAFIFLKLFLENIISGIFQRENLKEVNVLFMAIFQQQQDQ